MADENVRIVVTAVDKTRNGLTKVAGSLGSVTRALVSMRTGLTAVVGTAGIGLLVRQSLNATDALAKTAARIGTTTESLSRLQYAARISGISIEQTNMALQRAVRRTSEAARGTGEAQQALRELGVDAGKLAALPLDQAMLVLADAFKQVERGSDELRLAFKLFDSEGAAFVNVLRQGSDGLSSLYREANVLGAVMSQNAAKGVELANDAITRLFTLLNGLKDNIVAALAPAIEALVNRLTVTLVKASQASGGIREFARALAVDLLNGLANVVAGFGLAIRKVTEFANGLIRIANLIGDFFTFSGDYAALPEITFDVADSFGKAADEIRRFASGIQKTEDSLEGLVANSGAETESFLDRFKRVLGELRTETIPSLDQQLKNVAQSSMAAFSQGFSDAITGAKSFKDAIKSMAKSVIDSLIQMAIQYYITQQLFGALTGFFGGGGGTRAPITTATPAYVAPGRAVGGPVSAGRPYMVGENGPELFVPSASGSIQPNGRMNAGGITINQSVNFSTGITNTVRAEVLNLMPQIQEATKAAVANSRQRGGSFSKAMAGA